MSFRDSLGMIQCLFYVNELPGGEGHHDGGMKGRDGAAVLANPMLAAVGGGAGRARSSCGEQPRKTVDHPGASAEGHAESDARRTRT